MVTTLGCSSPTPVEVAPTPNIDATVEARVKELVAVQTSKSVKPTPEGVPIRVSLREILDLRDGNEVAADAKYIGMFVSMEGEISEIHEKDINIIPLGSDEFQMAGAKCSFNESQTAELIQLRKGQSITIVGIIKDIDDFMYNELKIKPCKFN